MLNFINMKPLKGKVKVPGDKSITHRALILGAIAYGTTIISNFLAGTDCLSTVKCLRHLGIDVEQKENEIIVSGVGLRGIKQSNKLIYVGNSGTTIRLLSGVLCSQNIDVTLEGDNSIKKRPMSRIIEPLSLLGAKIENKNGYIKIKKTTKFYPLIYSLPIPSAQVKSAILLSGLCAGVQTTVIENVISRNHTELMLKQFNANLEIIECINTTKKIITKPINKLLAQKIEVPGDISSAAFLIASALIINGSEIIIENVGINPTRTGILDVVKMMGADLEIINTKIVSQEMTADIKIKYSKLNCVKINGFIIPRLIDEIPIIAVLAMYAEGITEIRNAEELINKESNRLLVIAEAIKAMGGEVEVLADGLIIYGKNYCDKGYNGAFIETHKDHRIAMAFTVAGFGSKGNNNISDEECINISFPGFYKVFKKILL